MAVKIEDDFITADTEQELEQGLQERWSEICHRSAEKAAEEVMQIQQWESGLERLNQLLLAVAAVLILTFPFACLMMMKLNLLANAYISLIGD